MKRLLLSLIVTFPIYCQAQLLGPEPFNSDFLVHGSSAPTTVWFAPNYYTPIDYVVSGGCPGGRIGYSGSWNNYWGNFVRLPQVNATGMDSLKLRFDVSHSYSASTTNDWISFYIWADGAYQKVVSAVRINGVNAIFDFGANGKGFKFTELRSCAAVEVVFDLTSIIDKSSILVYLEPNCAYNNSNVYSVYFDNIALSNATVTPFSVSCRADTSFCIDQGVWTLSGCTPVGGNYSGNGVVAGTFNPATAGIGMHSIKYVATNGISTDSCYFNIEVLAQPGISILVLPNDTLCAADTLTLTASGGITQMWSNGVTNGVPFVPLTQPYIVQVLGANGCQSDSAISITVNPLPMVSLNLPFDTVCTEYMPPFPAYPLSGENPAGGIFSGSDVQGSNLIGDGVLGNRTTTVYYTYTNAYGCSASASDLVYLSDCYTGIAFDHNDKIILYPNPASDQLLICNAETITQIEVFDVTGKEVFPIIYGVNQNCWQLNISSLPMGSYWIQFYNVAAKSNCIMFVKE